MTEVDRLDGENRFTLGRMEQGRSRDLLPCFCSRRLGADEHADCEGITFIQVPPCIGQGAGECCGQCVTAREALLIMGLDRELKFVDSSHPDLAMSPERRCRRPVFSDAVLQSNREVTERHRCLRIRRKRGPLLGMSEHHSVE